MIHRIIFLALLYSSIGANAQITESALASIDLAERSTQKRKINFYVFNNPKTLDLFTRLVILRAKKQSMTRKKEFIVIKANSSKDAYEKIRLHMKKNNDAVIGTLWFDSHGHYANGYSSFILGKDEFNYKNIADTSFTQYLRSLSIYCNHETKIGIGSCYSGATFEKPATKNRPASKMNGDSLIIGMAQLFPGATIFGTEGWVMTKPGTFRRYSYALAGYPIQRRFKDEVYKPVWERMGIWHSYNSTTKYFGTINTLSLGRSGSIYVKNVNYLDKYKSKKRLAKNLQKLKPGLIKS